MTIERRFETAMRETGNDAPGLVLGDDGIVYQVAPDGTRSPVGGGGSSAVLQATVTLEAADILALYDTEFAIVDAPGAGKVVMPITIASVLNFATTPYTDPEGINAYFGEGDSLAAADLTNMNTAIQGAESFISYDPFDGAGAVSVNANQPLLILAVGQNPADGDSTLTVTVTYALIDVT